jgi:hypothetical protein
MRRASPSRKSLTSVTTMWAGACDQHVLADEIERERGVRGVAERIEQRRHVIADRRGQLERIEGRNHQILRE